MERGGGLKKVGKIGSGVGREKLASWPEDRGEKAR